ncbi:hypothetical protein H5410_025681 [Solanum commersonii]|uniref:Uncharacterized protein n=1 Tax=Solanum commersonii TaxID=4109 RepID=A0A9J5YWJ1_SOLCO|nr:hypothetical protein H5410_025681 [Solanum commersonii]
MEPMTFNILTQTPPHNKNATPAKRVGTSQNKKQITGKKKKTQLIYEGGFENPNIKKGKNDCGMYTCLFAEYINNEFLIWLSLIAMQVSSSKEKTKNDDGAISESEVIGYVARKFGGPRIAKEHAPNTSNYPTPRTRKSNLR